MTLQEYQKLLEVVDKASRDIKTELAKMVEVNNRNELIEKVKISTIYGVFDHDRNNAD